MFYMVRLSEEDEMMQLFCWRFAGEEDVPIFCMSRLVMGNKPSTNLSIIAVNCGYSRLPLVIILIVCTYCLLCSQPTYVE